MLSGWHFAPAFVTVLLCKQAKDPLLHEAGLGAGGRLRGDWRVLASRLWIEGLFVQGGGAALDSSPCAALRVGRGGAGLRVGME